MERRSARALGELRIWRRRAGVDEAAESYVEEPYAAELAGDWECASALWAGYGCPYDEALALAAGGTKASLRRAHERLLGLGARPAARIVARRLRERGVRGVPRGPRRAARGSPVGLTAREDEVLQLLAEGLTNAKIAERLVLSRRTVRSSRLGDPPQARVHTRGQAVARAGRLELLRDR